MCRLGNSIKHRDEHTPNQQPLGPSNFNIGGNPAQSIKQEQIEILNSLSFGRKVEKRAMFTEQNQNFKMFAALRDES